VRSIFVLHVSRAVWFGRQLCLRQSHVAACIVTALLQQVPSRAADHPAGEAVCA